MRVEYIHGDASYARIAEKYGVRLHALSKRAREENWAGERRAVREQKRAAAKERQERASREVRASA